jgi:hypothetical protein
MLRGVTRGPAQGLIEWLAAELLRLRAQHIALAERIALAQKALVDTGYFKPHEVGNDIAPRIAEYAHAMQQQNLALAERCAAQSEALAKAAERQEWSREPLTAPGWYWWRRSADGDEPMMIRVRRSHDDATLHVYQGRGHYAAAAAIGGEWKGPLKP